MCEWRSYKTSDDKITKAYANVLLGKGGVGKTCVVAGFPKEEGRIKWKRLISVRFIGVPFPAYFMFPFSL